jgi:hypothetical protein
MVGKLSFAMAPATARIGRVVAAFTLTLGSAIAAFGQAPSPTSGVIRLVFPPGSTELTASGTVSANGRDRYEVDISAAQPLLLHLDSAPGAVAIEVTDASTQDELPGTGQGTSDFQALIPRSGTYYVDVMAGRTQAMGQSFSGGAYVLSVVVPAPVRFGPGGVAAVRGGLTPGGLPVDYLLEARAGQTLLLDLASHGGEASLSVSYLVNGHALIESKPARHGQVALRIPESTSFVISVGPANGSDVSYTLDIVVPAISLPDNPIYAGFPAARRIVVVAEKAGPGRGNAKTIFSSHDNGATWRTALSRSDSADSGNLVGLPVDGRITGVTFRNGDDGFIAVARVRPESGSLGPFLYTTSDGGATWSPVELPFLKDARPDLLAGFAPSAPRFIDAVDGSMAVDFLFPSGKARSVTYATTDGGITWTVTKPASGTQAQQPDDRMKIVPAPVIPDAVLSLDAVAGCLSSTGVNVDPARIGASRMFSGKPIGSWIKQVQGALSMPVAAFDASISPDGRRLAITFLTCYDSQSATMPISTIFAVMDGNGNVTYLTDENGTAYFDGYTTSNNANIYNLYGWLSNSQAILVYAPGFDPGAGGSCEPTPWISINLSGQPGARFQTVSRVYGSHGNSDLFYVGPAPCYDYPHEIHRVETATGKDTIVYTGPEESILILDGVSPRAGGETELHYHLLRGAAQTVVVP